MMQITDVILIALFIEAIVNVLKPIWCKEDGGLSISEYVSMGLGILLAVACRINMLAYVVETTYPLWVEYTLWNLAKKLLGKGGRWTEIAALNNISGTMIRDGQVLKIPA